MTYPPCKGCDRRYPGCHSKCSDYQQWKAAYEEERDWKRSFNSKPPLSPEMQRIVRDKIRKGRRNH